EDYALQSDLGRDISELLMQELLDHLQIVGNSASRRDGSPPEAGTTNICFIEPKYAGSGPDEQAFLVQHFHERHGMKILHADPAELELRDNEVRYSGERIDLGYRDYSVEELLELESKGVSVEPMRTLF